MHSSYCPSRNLIWSAAFFLWSFPNIEPWVYRFRYCIADRNRETSQSIPGVGIWDLFISLGTKGAKLGSNRVSNLTFVLPGATIANPTVPAPTSTHYTWAELWIPLLSQKCRLPISNIAVCLHSCLDTTKRAGEIDRLLSHFLSEQYYLTFTISKQNLLYTVERNSTFCHGTIMETMHSSLGND